MSLSEAFDKMLMDELEQWLMEQWEEEEKEKINYHPPQKRNKWGGTP